MIETRQLGKVYSSGKSAVTALDGLDLELGEALPRAVREFSAGTLTASRLEPHEVAEVLTRSFSVAAISA